MLYQKKNFFNGIKYLIIFSFYITSKRNYFFNGIKYLIIFSFYIILKKNIFQWHKIFNNFLLLNYTPKKLFF